MIHKPWTIASGDADEMMRAAAYLETIQAGLETTYQHAARDGVTAEQIHELVNAETWLTGKDAAELFDISITEAAPTLNCIGGKLAAKIKPPTGLVINKTERTETPEPTFDEEVEKFNLQMQAKAKAALAMKGAILS